MCRNIGILQARAADSHLSTAAAPPKGHGVPARRAAMPPLALRRLVGVAVVPGRHRAFQGAVGLLRHVFVLDLDEAQRELVHRARRSEEHTSELQSLMRISI